VFTARYGLNPYTPQIGFVFKSLRTSGPHAHTPRKFKFLKPNLNTMSHPYI
jgi:hypothetical protein